MEHTRLIYFTLLIHIIYVCLCNEICFFFSFLIGGDGNVYEGAGWHKVGAHTRGYNTRSLGIAFIGNYQGR